MTLHRSLKKILFITLLALFVPACQTALTDDVAELPGELSVLPDPRVVPYDQLTEEIRQQEAERSTAEGVLIVRYPESEFEEIYGDIRPLEEQPWWPEVSGGVTPEEYLLANHAGDPYLATIRDDGYVYALLQCMPKAPNLDELCVYLPAPIGCVCSSIGPGWEVGDIEPVTGASCEQMPPGTSSLPCKQRTGCSTRCESFGTSPIRDGVMCQCRDDLEIGGS